MEHTQSHSGVIQRLNQAIMAAMQALRQSGHGGPYMGYPQTTQGFGTWTGQGQWGQRQQSEQFGTEQFTNAVHDQLRQALRERLTEAGRDRLVETIKEGLRETLRERLSFALRNAMAEAQYGPQGFDPNRVAHVLCERLSDAIERRIVEIVRGRFVAVAGERLDDAIRSSFNHACSGAGFGIMTGERDLEEIVYELRDQLLETLRHGLEERLCERLHDTVRERVQDAVRDRLASALQEAIAQGGNGPYGRIDTERVCAVLEDRLSEAIRDRVADGVRDRAADAIREQVEEVTRERLRKALWNMIAQHGQHMLSSSQGFGSFGNPQGMGSFGAGLDPDRLAENVCERLTDAVHGCITAGLRGRIKEALRERLSEAIRTAMFEGQSGGMYGNSRPSPLNMH